MTDLRTLIAHYREIEKAATPGPWEDLPSERHNHRSFVTGFPTVGWRVVAECSAQDSPQVDRDAALIATARNIFAALLDVAEAAEWACDGSGCEFEDERVRYETWQHHVGAMRALREKLAKFGEAMEANRD